MTNDEMRELLSDDVYINHLEQLVALYRSSMWWAVAGWVATIGIMELT